MSTFEQETVGQDFGAQLRVRPPATGALAALVGVSKRLGDVPVVAGANLAVNPEEVVVVHGPSGSGKSTLLRLLLGLERPDEGEVWLLGQRIDALPRRRLANVLREVGIGFQDPLLDDARTVLENLIALGRANRRFSDRHAPDRARLTSIVDGLELAPLLGRQCAVLSGGQKLRVALGRALVPRPRILVLDEPTHMIDPAGKASIYRELSQLVRAERLSALIVSHDDEARAICDRAVDIADFRAWRRQDGEARPQRGLRSTRIEPRHVSAPPASEPFLVGSVTMGADIEPTGFLKGRRPAHIRRVHVRDPYVEVWSELDRADVATIEAEMDGFARERRLASKWERMPGTAYVVDVGDPRAEGLSEWGDPVASAKFYQLLGSPSADVWRSLVPSAAALSYLADPWHSDHIDTPDGSRVRIDDVARRMFTLVTDAVAIRSRASVMVKVVQELLARSRELDARTPLRWMSVACGTALPAMKAAVHAGARPHLLLLDFDAGALRQAQSWAERVGFSGQFETRRMNIFDASAMGALKGKLAGADALPDLVDMMGIFEYTGPNLGVDPVRFLASVWTMLRPGGSLILGQMLDTRPLPDFTMGVVPWPYVEMRSLSELLEITTAAGIPAGHSEIYLPGDGVYAVLCATKLRGVSAPRSRGAGDVSMSNHQPAARHTPSTPASDLPT